jgi:hypothetical protein
MQRPFPGIAALALASGFALAPVEAASFNANFNDGAVPDGMTLADPAKIVPAGGVGDSGYLSLTDAVGSLSGAATIADFNAAEIVGGFNASLKLRIGNGSGRPADGFSLSYGTDVTDGAGGEEGSGNGLRIILDTYDNGGGEAPALDVMWGGVVVAHTLWAGAQSVPIPQLIDPATGQIASLQTGTNFLALSVNLAPNGVLDVAYKGITVFTNLVIPGYTPLSEGRFVLSARTGGEFETHWVDDIAITTFAPATGAPTFLKDPASQSVPERGTVTFSFIPNGAPPYTFQWFSNDVAIAEATLPTFTISNVTMAENNFRFKVNVANADGTKDSAVAILTVVPDSQRPSPIAALGSESFTEATITFSEDLDPNTAGNKDNYTIAGLSVSGATVVSPRSVKLTTATQTQGASYTVTINNVTDTAATPNPVAPNSTVSFSAFSYQRGGLRMEIFTDIAGTTIGDLMGADKYINNAPDITAYTRQFSSRPVYGGGVLDNYGGRLSGWIIPTESADYNFFIRSDDLSQLYLSPNDNPAEKVLIAEVFTCCGPFRETNLDPAASETSAPVALVAGQRYYIEALWKEGGGGDYADVAWRKVGDTFTAQALPFIQGNVLEALAPPNSFVPPTASIASPADNSSVEVGAPVTLVVNATAAAGKTIAKVEFYELTLKLGEATAPPYSITLTNLSEDAHKFMARVTDSSGISLDTTAITLSVGGLRKQVKLLGIDDVTAWKYDRSGLDLGTEWSQPAYDDSAWPSGKALIADETTAVVEPIRTPISRFNDAGEYVRTFYFRSHFNFPGAVTPGVKLAMRHVVDDGVVVYLNGHEVHRFGITDDPVTFVSNAAGHENAYEGPFDIPTAWLKTGDNVFSAEVHQSGGSSSDVVFGLELVATIPAVTQTLFAIDDVTAWKYDRTGRDLGTEWSQPAYDDSAWPSGKALIADETTAVVEPIRTPISRFNDEGEYVRTFYFRHKFNFPGELDGAKLKLRHVVDDGAVFYVNGHEVTRFGITDDPVTFISNAAGHENAYEGPLDIPTTWLKTGENVFAVEVHQSGGSSSDVVFGAELVGTFFPAGDVVVPPTRPTMTVTSTTTSISIAWTEGGTLQQSDTVNGTYTDITPTAANPYVIASPAGTKFFRVRK